MKNFHKLKTNLYISSLVTITILAVMLLSSCDLLPRLSDRQKILFIGNSYTMTSSIPKVFEQLANSAGRSIEVGIAADKGGDFVSYASSGQVQNMLQSEEWDYVILQEQTQIPSIQQFRDARMYPGARDLVQQVRAVGAIPIFFQTSGNRNGWPENNIFGYKNMQLEIIKGYSHISQELDVAVAPVGYAWYVSMDSMPQIDLWVDDRHPNAFGAYLSACTFYTTIFRDSPVTEYTAGLPEDLAIKLITIASDSVLNNLQKWNLD